MAREDTPLDQETFDRVLAEELAKGGDRRVAEGRARSAAVRAYKAAHGEAPATPAPAAPAAATPAPTAPAAGDGDAASGGAESPAPAAASAPVAVAPAAAAVAAGPAVAVATTLAPARQAPAPTGNVPEPKKGAQEKHRLLALVPPEGIQRVEREQGDRINVWPHLLIEEFVAMLVMTVGLVIFSTFINAPLRELANPNLTPNPSKAPWYFLGLQELLRYFHPMVAGVLFAPTLVLLALAVVPYIDRNPSTKPGDRKIAITLFTMLMMFGATLTIIGSFFRGTGYNWVWPWAQGVFFEAVTGILAISSGTLAAIVVIVILDLFAVMFGLSFVRARREQRAVEEAATAAALGQPAPKAPKPMSRREFFRKSLVASLLIYGAQFGGATLAFLWPSLKGGFGSVINAGKIQDIKDTISSTEEPVYSGSGRFYIVPYDGRPSGDVDYEAEQLAAQGVMPLYQRCVHLGCRVPFCAQSQWFECPCHGSKYNTAGEYKLGPAPRGMDRFHIEISEAGDVMVDTSEVILGPPRGTDTLHRPQAGPFCVAPG